MKRIGRSYRSITGVVVIIFITLVGALGYTYVLNYKAEVATAPAQSNSIAAQSATIPTIESTDDLDTALAALDAASVDDLSEDDLQALEDDLKNL